MSCGCNKSISYSIQTTSLDLNAAATVCKYTIDNSIPSTPYIRIVGYNTSMPEDCATLIANEPVGSVKYILKTSSDSTTLSIMKTIAKWIDDNLSSTGHEVTYQGSTYNQYGIINSCTPPVCSFNIV